MKQLVILVMVIFNFSQISLADETGVYEIEENHNVYYRYHAAEQGEPTIVLLNGLIYDLDQWDDYFKEMKRRKFGVLQLAYSTQPESLKSLDGATPYWRNHAGPHLGYVNAA